MLVTGNGDENFLMSRDIDLSEVTNSSSQHFIQFSFNLQCSQTQASSVLVLLKKIKKN